MVLSRGRNIFLGVGLLQHMAVVFSVLYGASTLYAPLQKLKVVCQVLFLLCQFQFAFFHSFVKIIIYLSIQLHRVIVVIHGFSSYSTWAQ